MRLRRKTWPVRCSGAIDAIEEMVANDTAAIFGIEARGVLREGGYADINVTDFDNLAMELRERPAVRSNPLCESITRGNIRPVIG